MKDKLKNIPNYDDFLDIEVMLESELARVEISIKELLDLKKGSIIDLKKPIGENSEIYINKMIIGKGEVFRKKDNLAVQLDEIIDGNSIFYYLDEEI